MSTLHASYPNQHHHRANAAAGVPLIAGLLGISCFALGCGSDGAETAVEPLTVDSALAAEGRDVFRFDTFGDESFWTDTLKMNEVIESAVDPTTALSVGLKVDAAALPDEVVQGILDGSISLASPDTRSRCSG